MAILARLARDANKRGFETLPAKAFKVLLDLLENKPGGHLHRAADLLTPI